MKIGTAFVRGPRPMTQPQPRPTPVIGGFGAGVPSSFSMVLPAREYAGQERLRRRR